MISGRMASYHFLDRPSGAEGRGFPLWLPQAGEGYRSALASNCHRDLNYVQSFNNVCKWKAQTYFSIYESTWAWIHDFNQELRTRHIVDNERKDAVSGREENPRRQRPWLLCWRTTTIQVKRRPNLSKPRSPKPREYHPPTYPAPFKHLASIELYPSKRLKCVFAVVRGFTGTRYFLLSKISIVA